MRDSKRGGHAGQKAHPADRSANPPRGKAEPAASNERRDLLWSAVRGQQIKGLPFRRQHPVGRFVLDFYCPRKKLCVELDGGIHDEQQERDAARTEALARLNIRVIRFRNEEVLHDLAFVVRRIETALEQE